MLFWRSGMIGPSVSIMTLFLRAITTGTEYLIKDSVTWVLFLLALVPIIGYVACISASIIVIDLYRFRSPSF